jgi:DNA-binding NarL/FixJ family response regulator
MPGSQRAPGTTRVFVVSPVRIYREGLTQVLATRSDLTIVGSADSVEDALPTVRRREVDVVLYDLRCPSGLVGLRRLAGSPEVSVIALGVEESPDWVIACAEAGIAGYVTDSTSLDGSVARMADAVHGDFDCPPHIAAGLLRRLAVIGPASRTPTVQSRLTTRELEVATLLQQGLSNKQIARRLTIQLPTVKNHVHSILRKLDAPTRREAAEVLRTGGGGRELGDPRPSSNGHPRL